MRMCLSGMKLGMCKAMELFDITENYMNANLLKLSNCVGICTDETNWLSQTTSSFWYVKNPYWGLDTIRD